MPVPDQLRDFLEAAKTAALRAADVLDEWRTKFRVAEKGRFDLVTDADLASQRAIQAYLLERFPTHGFLGEEEDAAKVRPGPDAPPTWIIDPIDGTTNYIHDFPFYCISIGLQVSGELIVGVVYDPPHREMFWAAQGMGAWLNEQRLRTSRVSRIEDALIATGFPPDLRGNEQVLQWWRHLSFKTQSLRRTGSTALNLAYIAAGRFDGYWAFDNHVWDVAGATAILREAGGQITNVDGTAYDPYTPDALASNGVLHPALWSFSGPVFPRSGQHGHHGSPLRPGRISLQWRADLVVSENSLGFHASADVVRILAESIDFSRQGILKLLKAD